MACSPMLFVSLSDAACIICSLRSLSTPVCMSDMKSMSDASPVTSKLASPSLRHVGELWNASLKRTACIFEPYSNWVRV